MSVDTDIQTEEDAEATAATDETAPEAELTDPLEETGEGEALSDPLGGAAAGGESVQFNIHGRRQGSGPKVEDSFRGIEEVLAEGALEPGTG